MAKRWVAVGVVLAAVYASSGAVSAEQDRPLYVISTTPSSFPTDFNRTAKNEILNCCKGSVRADVTDVTCSAEPCEYIFIADTPLDFTITFKVKHTDDVTFFGQSNYDPKSTADRQRQVLDWLAALIKCDDSWHHQGAADLSHRSLYCQLCQLPRDIIPADIPATRP